MSARDVIAKALRLDADDPAVDSWAQKVWPHRAQVALAALETAWYAVVKLPAPSGHDCYLRDVWDVSADYHVIRYPDGAVGLAENGGYVTEYRQEDAVVLALALLAAACHADREGQ